LLLSEEILELLDPSPEMIRMVQTAASGPDGASEPSGVEPAEHPARGERPGAGEWSVPAVVVGAGPRPEVPGPSDRFEFVQ
jgi:hypothetical protein